MSFQLSLHRNPAYALAGVLVCLVGCASAPDRPARSSVGCAEAPVDQLLPSGLSDKRAHCIAGGLIARFCSPTEARLAGLGKEVRDAFGPGDADWAGSQAARAGRERVAGGVEGRGATRAAPAMRTGPIGRRRAPGCAVQPQRRT